MKLIRLHNGPTARVTRVDHGDVLELYIACAPALTQGQPGGFVEQAESMYEVLARTLEAEGARHGVVLSERVFLADIDAELPQVEPIRRSAYARLCGGDEYLPATSWVKQPPCSKEQLCAVQVHAFVPTTSGKLLVRALSSPSRYGIVRAVEVGSTRHVYIANVAGQRAGCDEVSFEAQASTMFREASDALERAGGAWNQVMRTWFWLADIDRDYAAFNVVRNRFYRDVGLTRLPASTGIAGVPYPSSLRCAMDLYVVQSREPLAVEPMHSATMNEAPAYGAAFARGMKIGFQDSSLLLISGTASIDDQGRTIHVGEVEAQVERTFENIGQLLAAQNATMDNVVSMISYLKSASSLETFGRVLRRRGVPSDIPNTIVEAGVCRPEWLVEVEAIAVVSCRRGSASTSG